MNHLPFLYEGAQQRRTYYEGSCSDFSERILINCKDLRLCTEEGHTEIAFSHDNA